MANENHVALIGRLTRDPEVRYTANRGTAVGDISIAVNNRYKTQDGSWKEETTYVDVEAWGKLAEIAKEYLSKGREVYITGQLKTDQWEKDGKKFSKLKVVAKNIQFLGATEKADGSGDRQRPSGQREESPARAAQPERETFTNADGDDIPF